MLHYDKIGKSIKFQDEIFHIAAGEKNSWNELTEKISKGLVHRLSG